ncbi:hypothetical protein ACVWXO_001807 [Bradyrhizobium sp. LM2.7]
MHFLNTLFKLVGNGISFVDRRFSISQLTIEAVSGLLDSGRWLVKTYGSPSRASFILKTVSEFLKCAGPPIVLLLVQSLFAILLITVVITAIAVFVERYLERQ